MDVIFIFTYWSFQRVCYMFICTYISTT